MTHAAALTAQNGLLVAIHYAIQDDPSEAGRLLYQAHKSLAESPATWTAEEAAWLKDLDNLQLAVIGRH